MVIKDYRLTLAKRVISRFLYRQTGKIMGTNSPKNKYIKKPKKATDDDIDMKVLDIVNEAVEFWREKLAESYKKYKGFLLDDYKKLIEDKLRKSFVKIKEIVPDEEKRKDLIEQSLLASLNNSDYLSGIRAFGLLKNLYDLMKLPKVLSKLRSEKRKYW